MSDNWKADLQPLFTPRSIALIGASESSSRSRALFNNLTEFGYRGEIFPVHPTREKVFGLKCYPRVTDIPEVVDACVIAIQRDHVIAALEGCAEKGVQAGVIVSAGFAEASAEGEAAARPDHDRLPKRPRFEFAARTVSAWPTSTTGSRCCSARTCVMCGRERSACFFRAADF